MENKKCRKCSIEYPATVEYFSERKNTKSGLRAQCRKCYSLYHKQYEAKNKERRQIYRDSRVEYRKQYYEENREQRQKYLIDNAEHIKKEEHNTTRKIQNTNQKSQNNIMMRIKNLFPLEKNCIVKKIKILLQNVNNNIIKII